MNDHSFALSRPGVTSTHHTVSASDLVRQFGIWQEAATREPIYILHRGRPRLVLASVDIMSALCAPHDGDRAHFEAREGVLLDTMSEPAIVVDANLVVVAIGRPARNYFGERAMVGAPIDAVMSPVHAPFVAEATARVIACGIGETVEIVDESKSRSRRLELTIAPHPAGALLVGHDRSVEDARDEAQARSRSGIAALAGLPNVALARINLRGYLNDGDPSLVRMTQVPADALTHVRFPSLFDIGSRALVGEAVESVISDGQPRTIAARLLVAGSTVLDVDMSLAPQYRRATVIGALAVIAARQG